MKDKDAPQSSILSFSKLVRDEQAGSEKEKDAATAFQEARARSSEALMLDVRLKDGTVEMFDYASLRRGRYRPDGTLVLRFDGDKVLVEGTNLERLRRAIGEHRVRFIQEGTEAERDVTTDDAAHIECIRITEGEDKL